MRLHFLTDEVPTHHIPDGDLLVKRENKYWKVLEGFCESATLPANTPAKPLPIYKHKTDKIICVHLRPFVFMVIRSEVLSRPVGMVYAIQYENWENVGTTDNLYNILF